MKQENADIVSNANQIFIKFYSESDYMITLKNCKRTSRGTKTSTKLGFILIVIVELNESALKDPFAVFVGTKIRGTATIVSRLQVRNYKHSIQREDSFRTLRENF